MLRRKIFIFMSKFFLKTYLLNKTHYGRKERMDYMGYMDRKRGHFLVVYSLR